MLKTQAKDFISDEKMMEEVFDLQPYLSNMIHRKNFFKLQKSWTDSLQCPFLEMIRNYRSMLLYYRVWRPKQGV